MSTTSFTLNHTVTRVIDGGPDEVTFGPTTTSKTGIQGGTCRIVTPDDVTPSFKQGDTWQSVWTLVKKA